MPTTLLPPPPRFLDGAASLRSIGICSIRIITVSWAKIQRPKIVESKFSKICSQQFRRITNFSDTYLGARYITYQLNTIYLILYIL